MEQEKDLNDVMDWTLQEEDITDVITELKISKDDFNRRYRERFE